VAAEVAVVAGRGEVADEADEVTAEGRLAELVRVGGAIGARRLVEAAAGGCLQPNGLALGGAVRPLGEGFDLEHGGVKAGELAGGLLGGVGDAAQDERAGDALEAV